MSEDTTGAPPGFSGSGATEDKTRYKVPSRLPLAVQEKIMAEVSVPEKPEAAGWLASVEVPRAVI